MAKKTKDDQIVELQMLFDAASRELVRSQDLYCRKIAILRTIIKCLINELPQLHDNHVFQERAHRFTLFDIKKEIRRRS